MQKPCESRHFYKNSYFDVLYVIVILFTYIHIYSSVFEHVFIKIMAFVESYIYYSSELRADLNKTKLEFKFEINFLTKLGLN